MAKTLDIYIPSTPFVNEEGCEHCDPSGLWLEVDAANLEETLTNLAKARRLHNGGSDVQEFVVSIHLGGDDS